MELDLEELDGMNVGNFLDDAWHATKSVIKSPITKAVAGGVAIVFPPVGVPAAAALVVADRVVRASDSKDPKIAAKAKATIKNTLTLAEQGNTHAAAAAKVFDIAKAHAPSSAALSAAGKSAAAAAAAAGARGSAAKHKARSKGHPIVAPATPAGWVRALEGAYQRAS